jgi:hypothetical protein
MYIFAQPIAEEHIRKMEAESRTREQVVENSLASSGSIQEVFDAEQSEMIHCLGGEDAARTGSILNDLQILQKSADFLSSEARFLQNMLRNANQGPGKPQIKVAKLLGTLIQRGMALNSELERIMTDIDAGQLGNDDVHQHIERIKNMVADGNSVLAGFPQDLLKQVVPPVEGVAYQNTQNAPYFATHSPSELFVLKLEIENRVDGEVVERPGDLQNDSDWTVEYTLEEVEGASALETYYAMKTKYLSKFREEKATDGFYNGLYMRRLMELSEKGRKWREAQNRIDSVKRKIVYQPTYPVYQSPR